MGKRRKTMTYSSGDGGTAGSSNEVILRDPPTDGISAVKFGQTSNQFLVASSWDGFIRLYDIQGETRCRAKFDLGGPVLDTCFQGSSHVWSAGVHRSVRLFDINQGTELKAGSHEDTVRCIEYASDVSQIVSGGWDGAVKLWDPRKPIGPISSHSQDNKVYAIAIAGERIIVGTANRKVLIWDLRNMAFVLQKRDSSLKFQTRAIKAFPDKTGYVLSSIEGRVAVEYLDPSPEAQKKKYAFKCHRMKDPSTKIEHIYPVNAIAFHTVHGTFATGGSDGFVNVWDGRNKKRLCQFHKFPTSISSLAFSPDGSALAIAASFQHEYRLEQNQQPPADQIYIRHVTDQETKPK
ncbi:mitotic checkpoint protein BUB3-like isoform X1 [Varroa destructor]|uniref:Mitotic checkpoint protein BUB3 n=1 Tax=Varroa destructor TaxID=109461 RepID=A0A7M7MCV7_VARDE|nr:mitotic checkpoint protein BUB3-like isoform X1 [Varroa destructor]